MKPEDVPAEWVEPVAMALTNAYCRGALGSEPYTDLNVWRSVSGYERFMADARAALAAVIPLIEAREREACGRLSERIAHQFEQDDPRHETGWVVADAIRARGETQ